MRCRHMHKDDPENAICEDCGKPWNSEYHRSDECVNLCEDCACTKAGHEDLKKTEQHLENLKLMKVCGEFK